MGAPLVAFDPKMDASFAVKMPINQDFSDCAFPARPGQLFNEPNPALAQAPMAGGKRSSRKRNSRKRNSRKHRSRKHRGGACGCSVVRGGSRSNRSNHSNHSGGGNGVAVDPSISVGGLGPNVAPIHSAIPCDVRAGSPNPLNPVSGSFDPRAPTDLYSLTANTMRGGAYSTGNDWAPACYKAPGSELPVYEAQTAAFRFNPSTATGGVLPDGVTPFNDVVPYAGRLGGSRRKSNRKSNRKNSRKNSRK